MSGWRWWAGGGGGGGGGGGSGGGDVGRGRGISWEDPQLSDCSIFLFFLKRRPGQTDGRMDRPSYGDELTHLKRSYTRQHQSRAIGQENRSKTPKRQERAGEQVRKRDNVSRVGQGGGSKAKTTRKRPKRKRGTGRPTDRQTDRHSDL